MFVKFNFDYISFIDSHIYVDTCEYLFVHIKYLIYIDDLKI